MQREPSSGKILMIDTVHPALMEILADKGFSFAEDYTGDIKTIAARHHDAAGLVIRSRFRLGPDELRLFPGLKFIARAGAGMENIDVAWAELQGIRCLHAPEGNRDAVAEHALGMLLALFNRLTLADSEVRKGLWRREENRGIELMGKTVGVIGFGNTGSAFVKRLQGFDVNVLVYDRYKQVAEGTWYRPAGLADITEKADVVSLHVPLTGETERMIDEKFIRRMRKAFWLINTSRGSVVDTAALAGALEKGKVLGACLDVLEFESLSFEQVNDQEKQPVMKYLQESQRVVLTPHVAGWTFESHRKISEVLARKILELMPVDK